ncbi:MAG: M23 family metallopeptidase [candidate division Zixibacteria bacterium]|nr:M23 family metallopeptidase [candidate division Zixibacteria bacterium]
MSKISTKTTSSLILVIILFSISYASGATWPVKSEIDLSSGFGDLRNNRFHAGIDIRTGGVIGREVFSPADGYVWRIKLSYNGYGKALYIKGDDGFLYVFGHLKDFNDQIDKVVKQRQIADERYYQDLYLPADSLRIIKNSLIAFSGETGTGAPHLHFEKRSPDNYPLNPLTHGYQLKDKTRPTFTRLGFQQTDDRSLFYDGTRKMFLKVVPGRKEGRFYLDTVLYFNRPFGILADCFDRIRPDGMKQAVYKLSLEIDGKDYYEVIFDTLDFDKGRLVNFEYDYEQAVQDEKRVRRLFHRTGNDYSGSRALDTNGGIVGLDPDFEVGLHDVTVTAEDCYGNTSELKFKFLWGPPGDIFHLDSTEAVGDSAYRFYFTPAADYKKLGIDTLYVLRCWGTNWLHDTLNYIYKHNPGLLVVTSQRDRTERISLKLVMITDKKCYIEDQPFNGITRGYAKNLAILYEPLDDGLLVTVATPGNYLGDLLLRIYRGEELLDEKYPARYINGEKYVFFLPPDEKYAVIDSLAVALNFPNDTIYNRLMEQVNIRLMGLNPDELLAVDSLFSVGLVAGNFYQPQFVTWGKKEIDRKNTYQLKSDLYHLFPEAMVTRRDFPVSYKLIDGDRNNHLAGLCWLDEKENRWFWLEDNLNKNNSLTASSMGGGIFAVVYDYAPPEIKDLSINNGDFIEDRQPLISFILEDTLSGITDDRNISIRLDDRWMIPEYNPENKICKTRPVEPLSRGKHSLKIEITDRVGNKLERFIEFRVNIKSKPERK